jgi:protein SCO1/2
VKDIQSQLHVMRASWVLLFLFTVCAGCRHGAHHDSDTVFLLENSPAVPPVVQAHDTRLRALLSEFCAYDETAHEDDIAECLDSLKVFGRQSDVGRAITLRLRESDPLYTNRGPKELIRLRGYLLVTLGAVGAPREAVPYLVTELKHANRRNPYLVAAAARGAGGLHVNRELLVPLLARYLNPREPDDVVDLDHYNSWPPQSPTSIKEEVLKTLIRFGDASIKALPDLAEAYESASSTYSVYSRNRRLFALAGSALNQLDPGMDAICCRQRSGTTPGIPTPAFFEEWRKPAERRDVDIFNCGMVDNQGATTSFQRFIGKPFVVTFFYSRCDNPTKCSMTISRLGELKKRVADEGLLDQLYLLAVTLDPVYDTPRRMESFATVRGMTPDGCLQLLRANSRNDHRRLMTELRVAVNYQADQVNVHGIELLEFDRKGRYVRRFAHTHWNTEEVVRDLQELVNEPL